MPRDAYSDFPITGYETGVADPDGLLYGPLSPAALAVLDRAEALSLALVDRIGVPIALGREGFGGAGPDRLILIDREGLDALLQGAGPAGAATGLGGTRVHLTATGADAVLDLHATADTLPANGLYADRHGHHAPRSLALLELRVRAWRLLPRR